MASETARIADPARSSTNLNSPARARPAQADDYFSITVPAQSSNRTSTHGSQGSKAKIRYMGNHPILGGTPALEKELRTRAQAEAAGPPSLMVEDFPSLKMPLRKTPPPQPKARPLNKMTDVERRTRLLGLPLSYTEQLFLSGDSLGAEEGSCFSPLTLRNHSLATSPAASPSQAEARIQAAESGPASAPSGVRLPPLDGSNRPALVTSLTVPSEDGAPPEDSPANAPALSSRLNLDLMFGTPDAMSHMDHLRDVKRRVREERQQQQDQQTVAILERLVRMVEDAAAKGPQPKVKAMESARLWMTYKRGEERGDVDPKAFRQQCRAVLRDRSPPPHRALLARKVDEEVDQVPRSVPKKYSNRRTEAVYRSPKAHNGASRPFPQRFARTPQAAVEVSTAAPVVPEVASSAEAMECAAATAPADVVRNCIYGVWVGLGLALPPQPESLFVTPYQLEKAGAGAKSPEFLHAECVP